MNGNKRHFRLIYYGDDFTGSTDALDFLGRSGISCVLFMDPPDASLLAKFPDIEAFGIAGMTRTMDPDSMEATLTTAFEAIGSHHPEFVHYKICSTFDSSPESGNIGTALRTGSRIFGTPCVPILAGNPILGRFSVFGNLFARMGTHASGSIYRIDQHPSMSRHPVTPARDGDLRDHLARQTDARIALLDILTIEKSLEECVARLEQQLQSAPDALLIDILDEHHFVRIGQLLDHLREEKHSLFTIGSSGIEAALCRFWKAEAAPISQTAADAMNDAGPILVASGSCSPVTAIQIETALSAGFCDIPIHVNILFNEDQRDAYLEETAAAAARIIRNGESVILHTSRGPGDPRLEGSASRPESQSEQARILGTALGNLIHHANSIEPVRRICLAGGDTSSHAARAMSIQAAEMISPFQPGAPLCRVHSKLVTIQGMEVNFKGGQVGTPDYFISLRNGNPNTETLS